jgi:hypothetical protein
MKATVLAESSNKLSFFIVICALQRCLRKVVSWASLSFLLLTYFLSFYLYGFSFILITKYTFHIIIQFYFLTVK